MKTTKDYLNEVAAMLGGVSDYRVAMTLGISTQAVSRWRSGQDSIGDDAAIKVAEILGIDPAEILLSSYCAKSKNAQARASIENVIRKLGGVAAALALVAFAGLFSFSSPVSAMPTADYQVSDSLYYVKSFYASCKRRLALFFASCRHRFTLCQKACFFKEYRFNAVKII